MLLTFFAVFPEIFRKAPFTSEVRDDIEVLAGQSFNTYLFEK